MALARNINYCRHWVRNRNSYQNHRYKPDNHVGESFHSTMRYRTLQSKRRTRLWDGADDWRNKIVLSKDSSINCVTRDAALIRQGFTPFHAASIFEFTFVTLKVLEFGRVTLLFPTFNILTLGPASRSTFSWTYPLTPSTVAMREFIYE